MNHAQHIADLEQELAAARAEAAALRARAADAESRLALMETTLELVPVGVVLADADGRILHGNSKVVELVRHPVLHSQNVDAYAAWVSFHADGRQVESHDYPLSRVLLNGEERPQLVCHYQRGDGSRCWIRITGMPVRNAQGELIGAAVAMIDIDEERRLAATQRVLIGELNHRVKNAFAVVKAIVSQSLRRAKVSAEVRDIIDRRLEAYGAAHAKLVNSTWEDNTLETLARDNIALFADGHVSIEGPEVSIPSRQALALSMAFYELSTNAAKYGALSVPNGRVKLSWRVNDADTAPVLAIDWTEHGGPPPTEGADKGFGSFVIDRALAAETGGQVRLAYAPKGFEWHLTMPLKAG